MAQHESTAAPVRRAGRLRGIPPAPLLRTPFAVLSVAPDAVALALFQGLRNVQVWASTPPKRRPALFRRVSKTVRERMRAAADAAPLLADPLAVFLALQETPGAMEPELVGLACHQCWEWAERCGLLEAALDCAETAAYADPKRALYATAAGHTAIQMGDPDRWARAEGWLARAAALALRARDRRERVRALTHWGTLLWEAERTDEAIAAYSRAISLARHGQKRRAAVAHHSLMGLYIGVGRLDEAERHAAQAFDLYRQRDERLPYLAHDLAFLLVRRRHYGLALLLVDVAGRTMPRPHEHGLLHGTTANAAGGIGRRARYEAAERAALECVELNRYNASPTLAGLARGAWHLGDWNRAERHAREALSVARATRDRQRAREALAVLRALRKRQPAPPAAEPEPGAPVTVLARRFAARLRTGAVEVPDP